MCENESGCGVQVVSVSGDGTYRVCVEALRGVAARAELRGLPVAVVSVAGATRGGKSFLLDFFLRYLRATASARSDGTWLGAEDEPLDGFSWRGGCERDTTGILLWSEPAVLTRGDGQKVVVLLMDTQGTFDSSITIRDSTTIFAMSTLLSSIQIFNLSMNIQEDHLQYLQLFTEYGKLAREDTGKPFQVLQFLVRDWSYAYQHPTGAVGGQQLLDKRLEITESQAEETKEVRQHIQSCFESVRCFLMPHPGLVVATSPSFTGCSSANRNTNLEFKDALLELVQGVFEENLTLKKINGQEVQVQELVEYFESYMEIFNSDELPTPVSILKATSSACLEVGLNAARELYLFRMERACELIVPRDVMPRLHAAAKDAARQAFLARRTLAAPDIVAERLDQLLQGLDHLLPNHIALNQAKLQTSKAAAKTAYEQHMLDTAECLLFSELEERHLEAVDLALILFDNSRLPPEDDDIEDEDRRDLQQDLQDFLELHELIQLKNDAKISAALSAAKQTYEEAILPGREVSTLCVHNNDLITMHRSAKNAAIELFESRWKTPESAQNEHRIALLDHLSERFREITTINVENNEKAVEMSIKFYENTMTYDILGAELCLHPLDLQREQKTVYDSAKTEFYRSRTFGSEGTGRDNYKLKLIQELPARFATFNALNEERNKTAVKKAHNYYERTMRVRRNLDHHVNAIVEFFGAPDFDMGSRHDIVKPEAIEMFKLVLRRDGPHHTEDRHLDDLNKELPARFATFNALNEERNKTAVKKAHNYYERTMRVRRNLDHHVNAIVEFFGAPDFDMGSRHDIVKPEAIEMFKLVLRRDGPHHTEDRHLDDLNKLIDESFNWLRIKLVFSVALPVAGLAGIVAPALSLLRLL